MKEGTEKKSIKQQVIFVLYRDEWVDEAATYQNVLKKMSPSGTIVSRIKISCMKPPSEQITLESCSAPFKEELNTLYISGSTLEIGVHLIRKVVAASNVFTFDGSYPQIIHEFLSPSNPNQFITNIGKENETITVNHPHIVYTTGHGNITPTDMPSFLELKKSADPLIVEYDIDLFLTPENTLFNQKSEILPEQRVSKGEHEEFAKNFLMQIRNDIFERCKGKTNKWETVFGDKIEIGEIGTNKKIGARVPTGVKLMLKEIEEAQTSDLWEAALENVQNIASDRLEYQPGFFSFFYKRYESTTAFYRAVVKNNSSLVDEQIGPNIS
jgi:hypothetical protein